ncbi:DUF3617 domain-containing protein [Sideroxydans lithotrophicus]|uniref:DUF3617 family protein n=1 Tax=Sideroxydans lithotrophicus (strain ES-1) TaxID=580332 RepID=D5CLT8_SIDLE|nr:DUF3617 domain-containing protein [Sideroxydans lithotrophicus]ADE12533.1 hypothetical protein Slit_2306 [Sideroxydans lithotrophicus ES-1]
MNKHSVAFLALMSGVLSAAAHAAPGEYWEVTNKMEMPGMPFAMPATTMKVCIPKGGENDPQKTSGDKDCKMTDIKTVGNKTTWKARCDRNGEVMTGSGEQTTSANGYQGKMRFSGKSGGEDMNMSMAFSGKRLGGSCDSEEAVKKAKAQMCDKSRYITTADWITNADLILRPNSACADQRSQLCDLVQRDTPKDVRSYEALLMHDQQMGSNISVAKECKLDMKATTKSICKKLDADNYGQLSAHCPAEAKAFRVAQRRRECEGRSYTAETRAADLKKCLSGKADSSDEDSSSEAPAKQSSKSSGSSTASDALEAAKKLKARFGF